jgi:hypothetical protein
VIVPRGSGPPYAIDDNKIYVRDESDTSLAVRDEIVALVQRSLAADAPLPVAEPAVSQLTSMPVPPPASEPDKIASPRTGVEIVHTSTRKGQTFHHMRDLRNNNVVKNVTRKSARRLWHYAIMQKENNPVDPDKVKWHGNIALLKAEKRGGVTRYDFAQRDKDVIRVYYGVTEDGIGGEWQKLVPQE